MGSLPIPESHAFTERAWSKVLWFEVERAIVGQSLVSDSPSATLCRKYDLEKGPGQEVTLKFAPYKETDGITEQENVYNRAGRIDLLDDKLRIDLLGNPYVLDSQMDQQRLSDKLSRIVYVAQHKFWHRRMERTWMWHLGGYLPGNTFLFDAANSVQNLQHVGHNEIKATDVNHMTRQGGHDTDEEVALDDSATIDFQTILDLETLAGAKRREGAPSGLDYPIAVGPDGYYDLIIDTQGWNQLGANTTATEFREAKLAEIQGGQSVKKNAIYNGYRGMYSRTRIHVSDYIAQGVKSADGTSQENVRRAVFLGAGAGAVAYGQGYGSEKHVDWKYEIFQVKKLMIYTDSVFGIKTLRYPSQLGVDENYGCIVRSYFSAAA